MNVTIDIVFAELIDYIKAEFLQHYYSQILGFQVLVNSFASQVTANYEVNTIIIICLNNIYVIINFRMSYPMLKNVQPFHCLDAVVY